MKTKEPKIEATTHDNDGFPMLKVVVNDKVFGFTLASVKEESREWMKDIVVREFGEIFEMGYKACQDDVQKKFKDFTQSFGVTI